MCIKQQLSDVRFVFLSHSCKLNLFSLTCFLRSCSQEMVVLNWKVLLSSPDLCKWNKKLIKSFSFKLFLLFSFPAFLVDFVELNSFMTLFVVDNNLFFFFRLLMHFVFLKVVIAIKRSIVNVTSHGMKRSIGLKASARLRNLKEAINCLVWFFYIIAISSPALARVINLKSYLMT